MKFSKFSQVDFRVKINSETNNSNNNKSTINTDNTKKPIIS